MPGRGYKRAALSLTLTTGKPNDGLHCTHLGFDPFQPISPLRPFACSTVRLFACFPCSSLLTATVPWLPQTPWCVCLLVCLLWFWAHVVENRAKGENTLLGAECAFKSFRWVWCHSDSQGFCVAMISYKLQCYVFRRGTCGVCKRGWLRCMATLRLRPRKCVVTMLVIALASCNSADRWSFGSIKCSFV